MKTLEVVSHAAGFAMASCEDPSYYGSVPHVGARAADAESGLPSLPAAYVAANADRRPDQDRKVLAPPPVLSKQNARMEWQWLAGGFGWGGGAAA